MKRFIQYLIFAILVAIPACGYFHGWLPDLGAWLTVSPWLIGTFAYFYLVIIKRKW